MDKTAKVGAEGREWYTKSAFASSRKFWKAGKAPGGAVGSQPGFTDLKQKQNERLA